MKYNPVKHHRRSIRLHGYDYSREGMYFITICCHDRLNRFGEIVNKQMILNDIGKIAYNKLMKLSERFPNFELDVFQIMPNHIHVIIVLLPVVGAGFTPAHVAPNDQIVGAGFTPAHVAPNDQIVGAGFTPAHVAPNDQIVGAGFTPAHDDNGQSLDKWATARVAPTIAPTIGNIVGAYKSLVVNECLKIFKSNDEIMGKLWQRNFYEHIIRIEQSYQQISNYIINNPANWGNDRFYIA